MNDIVRIPFSEHQINKRKICKKACSILKALTQAGYEAYLVGGAVRDLLLGKQPKDFDIATNAHPEQIKAVLPTTRIIGRRFRLAHVHFGREFIEVATFRAPHDTSDQGQISHDGRIIHDNVYGNVEEDALRRDFTVNALFYELKTGDILDFVDGMTDIHQRQLRLIGEPEMRYREDPVRMLRAIRFMSKLDFTMTTETEVPIKEVAGLLTKIAPARLFDETLKLFHSGYAVIALGLLREYQLFSCLFPLTEQSFDEDQTGVFSALVYHALENTDRRIRSDNTVNPAFLFAVMLWHQAQKGAKMYREMGNPDLQSVHLAASDVLGTQVKSIAVPRRFSNVTREIWTMQGRFQFKACRRSLNFMKNRRFRAAYDFMCLRASSGEPLEEECQWWTLFQSLSEKDQQLMCQSVVGSPNKRNRSGRRRRH
ncbi:MAG: polynucleotide adenylyltransferase PcnB [Cocleimonas sp.]|nr:polynucleotide adenylyltransferase PcnB [Cocleimonas sp.]